MQVDTEQTEATSVEPVAAASEVSDGAIVREENVDVVPESIKVVAAVEHEVEVDSEVEIEAQLESDPEQEASAEVDEGELTAALTAASADESQDGISEAEQTPETQDLAGVDNQTHSSPPPSSPYAV